MKVAWQVLFITLVKADDTDYNVVRPDGSFEFGYNNPDSYHYADGNRNNVVRGEFGGRNPKTGAIDTTVYTAGPRGYRPRGKNVYRKYDLNQNGPRPIGSPDDPYYDPYEDPSYNFAFRTRTYSREENANRIGDVRGKYTYLDDVGERHNVEFIAGKNTGFHVKTAFPDSNPRAYGPLYFRGRGRPLPRGRTSIQRGLDGSYKFVSAGPDQRRTEVSDSTNHVRGSYTYLDDKGVQHSVHYIAGPETGYRVLKTVKGAHLPAVFPFETPDIIPADFYDYGAEKDVFDTAASGTPFKPGRKPVKPKPTPDLGNGVDIGNSDLDRLEGDQQEGFGTFGSKKPGSGSTTSRPGQTLTGTAKPIPGFDEDDEGDDDIVDDLFGGGGAGGSSTKRPSLRPTTPRPSPTGRPTITTFKPSFKPPLPAEEEDDGSYKPGGSDDGSYKPTLDESSIGGAGGSSTSSRPGSSSGFSGYPSGKPTSGPTFDDDDVSGSPGTGLLGSESGRPFGSGTFNGGVGSAADYDNQPNGGTLQIGGGSESCPKCKGTLVTNIGFKPFHVPPGVSVRAHIQSIDLYPPVSAAPSEIFKAETVLKREQLNQAPSNEKGQSDTAEASKVDKNSVTEAAVQTTLKEKD